METVTYFCPHCWAEVPAEARLCPACGAVIEDARADIVDKYIAALRHPQAETRLRAAWILGQMRERRAVPALQEIAIARGQGDPYLLSTAAESLGLIGDNQAVPVLAALLADLGASFMARVQAAHALGRVGGDEAIAALTKAAIDTHGLVRNAALTALRQFAAKLGKKDTGDDPA